MADESMNPKVVEQTFNLQLGRSGIVGESEQMVNERKHDGKQLFLRRLVDDPLTVIIQLLEDCFPLSQNGMYNGLKFVYCFLVHDFRSNDSDLQCTSWCS